MSITSHIGQVLNTSSAFNAPILCTTYTKKKLFEDIAKNHNINIPEPTTIYDISESMDTVVIDDPETLLEYLLETKVILDYVKDIPDESNKITITKDEALSLLGFDSSKFKIVD